LFMVCFVADLVPTVVGLPSFGRKGIDELTEDPHRILHTQSRARFQAKVSVFAYPARRRKKNLSSSWNRLGENLANSSDRE